MPDFSAAEPSSDLTLSLPQAIETRETARASATVKRGSGPDDIEAHGITQPTCRQGNPALGAPARRADRDLRVIVRIDLHAPPAAQDLEVAPRKASRCRRARDVSLVLAQHACEVRAIEFFDDALTCLHEGKASGEH